ncbi:glycosyl hydrolase family 61-domain-containing protein [Ephemerocybe angulata]|uniref:lytic cellulose monooxygenase (C4-dehydrogenating) n=1 Tax=Ephemerocybe angulata TaxID=980116 RepID=A0A8H6LYZ4_9AGAR|nr:glycosyl hydrolase family 61-domain-containing protein [Tulosesus angulatus]
MKLSALAFLTLGARLVSAHYVFFTLTVNDAPVDGAVRIPGFPTPLMDVTSPDIICNTDTTPANKTATIPAGSKVGFKLNPNHQPMITHPGPAAFYMARVPDGLTAAEWDGAGGNWFKIAEWGVKTFEPELEFETFHATELVASIPKGTPSGEYLLRPEGLALQMGWNGYHQVHMSCAQIKVVDGGNGTPGPLVAIPGHLPPDHPGLNFDVYSHPTSYQMPGPAVWKGD